MDTISLKVLAQFLEAVMRKGVSLSGGFCLYNRLAIDGCHLLLQE